MILRPDCTVRLIDVRKTDGIEEAEAGIEIDDYRRPSEIPDYLDSVTLAGQFLSMPKRSNKRLEQGSVISSDRKIKVELGEDIDLYLGLQVEIISSYFGKESGRIDEFCAVPGQCRDVIIGVCLEAGHGFGDNH